MPLQATSGAASYDAFGGGVPVVPAYIEEVFSTYLYTGNGSTQTITNGIDLSTKGGLTWIKCRNAARPHTLWDTQRGALQSLNSSNTDISYTELYGVTAFNSNGFAMNEATSTNNTNDLFASWTFRKQPKFFDVVTYTGTGSNTTIAHALGAVPACIMVKRTDATGAWQVYHRSLANTEYLVLNTTASAATGATRWNSTTPTSSVFSLGTDANVNASGGTYVAYLFAHDAGGFGLTGTDNVISCGSFTADGSTTTTVNLGYEPQLVIIKFTSQSGSWYMLDTMRGMDANLNPTYLLANNSGAENTNTAIPYGVSLTSTGFNVPNTSNFNQAGVTSIYIAIRRGPMKVPTSGTSVFIPVVATNSVLMSVGFPTDLAFILKTGDGTGFRNRKNLASRLQGQKYLQTDGTEAETSTSNTLLFDKQNSFQQDQFGGDIVNYMMGRAPSFFDEVCYTGTGSATTVTHNLVAVPELIITKQRSPSTNNWFTYHSAISATGWVALNLTNATTTSSTVWNDTAPTSSVFTVGTASNNSSGASLVAYLFATCAGVSKVGSYTGNGSTQTIDCGFTGGARFVLIKRTDSTSGWYVYDTARGMTVLTDPYLFLNNTDAETTTLGSVTTVSTGFALNSSILAAINVSGGTYIFLAIA
jgi:hypothetical protein